MYCMQCITLKYRMRYISLLCSKTNKMRKLYILLICIYLTGCDQGSQNDGNTTELEGTWASVCFSGFSGFSGAPSTSQKIITTYHLNSVTTKVATYSDSTCSQLESTVDATQSTLFVDPENIPTSFKIGSEVLSANGINVKEIDFYTKTNDIHKNIYLLQDNFTTLYFGVSCLFSPNTCIGNRPTEIDFSNENTKT